MKAGFATRDITPAIGKVIPGLFEPRTSTGTLDPLQATACVVQERDRMIAIVAADAVSFSCLSADRIRTSIGCAIGIPKRNTVIAASHTHCGGPTNDVLGSDTDNRYLDQCVTLITEAAVEAHRTLQPAECGQVSGKHNGWAFNRRFTMRDGSEETQFVKEPPDIVAPAGPVDPEVGVIAFRGTQGNPLGAIANFTCHPTCIMGNRFTGDFPSYWRSALRELIHPDFTLVFLNGACGDISQMDCTNAGSNESGVAWASKMGVALAEKTQELVKSARYKKNIDLKTAHGSIDVAYRRPPPSDLEAARNLLASDAPWNREKWIARDLVLLAAQLEGDRQSGTCHVDAMRIGTALLASAPWQPFCEFGLRIKSRFPGRTVLLGTFANGMLGYVPTPRAFAGGGYEPTLCRGSRLAPDAGDRIVAEHLRTLEQLTCQQGQCGLRPHWTHLSGGSLYKEQNDD